MNTGADPNGRLDPQSGDVSVASLLGAVDPKALIESSPDGIVVADNDGRIVLINGSTETMFGYQRDELVGQPIEVLVPARMRDRHVDHRSGYIAVPTPRPMGTGLELLGLRKDGCEFPVEISLSPLVSESQRFFCATVRDVTDKVAAQVESLAILGTVDAAHDGVFMIDPETLHFTYANQGATNQLGFSNDDLLQMSAVDIMPEFTKDGFRAVLAPLLAETTESIAVTTIHRCHSGGELPVDIVFNFPPAPRSDIDRRVVALVRDISGRREIEVERDRGVRWLQSLAALRSTLMSDPPLHEVLTLACQQARQLTGSDAVAVCESITDTRPDRRGDNSGLFRFRYFDSNDTESLLASKQLIANEIVGRALGGSVVANRQAQDDPLGEANHDLTAQFEQVLLVPVEAAGVVAGLLFLGRHGEEVFDDNEISVATSLAAEAHNAYSLTDARRTKIQVKILEDRERLARDLHDLVIQRIFAAGLRLQSVQGLVESPLVQERLGDTINQLDETIAELRSAIFRLNTPSMSVSKRLEAIIGNAASNLGFEPTLQVIGDLEALPATVVKQLEPALSEALANVHRHADASAIELALVISDESLVLTVADNGVGFSSNAPRGNGLNNLEIRASKLGGTSSVASTTGEGTTLTWTASY